MKNILMIMKEFGIELPEEKKKEFEQQVAENYKTVADYEKQKEKLTAAEETATANDTAVMDLKRQLEGFKDIDVSALNQRITDLEKEKGALEADYQTKISDRDFNDIVKETISSSGGKNAKAIAALLDIETLKGSKNQKEDIATAMKALAEAEDSKMLFGESAKVVKTGNIIGEVTGNGVDAADAQMRSVMGLPPVSTTEQK